MARGRRREPSAPCNLDERLDVGGIEIDSFGWPNRDAMQVRLALGAMPIAARVRCDKTPALPAEAPRAALDDEEANYRILLAGPI